MLRTLKNSVLWLIRGAGGFRLVGTSRWRRNRLLILCYHGFALRDEHEWDPALFVTADHLDRRLNRLHRSGCTVLPLREALDRLREGRLPPRAVALTVDDGLYDFRARALPVLARHRLHATVYVSTYHVLDQRPVFNVMLAYLLWRAHRNGVVSVSIPQGGEQRPVHTPRLARSVTTELRRRADAEAWSADDRQNFLGQLAGAVREDWGALLEARVLGLMSAPELAALPPELVDVQLHTHRHRAPRDRELFLREIRDNRDALVRAGFDGSRLAHFCYPSGEHHPEFLPWLRSAGVQSATTCVPGLAAEDSDPLLLPRFIDTLRTPGVEFDAWAVGVRAILRRPVRQFSAP